MKKLLSLALMSFLSIGLASAAPVAASGCMNLVNSFWVGAVVLDDGTPFPITMTIDTVADVGNRTYRLTGEIDGVKFNSQQTFCYESQTINDHSLYAIGIVSSVITFGAGAFNDVFNPTKISGLNGYVWTRPDNEFKDGEIFK